MEPLWPEEIQWLDEEWTCGVTVQIPTTAQGESCDTMQLARCKRQNFRQPYTNGVFTSLTYEGHFRVCYRHDNGIVTVKSRFGDATQQQWPWVWKGNANGYPRHYRYAKHVVFEFRGQLDWCLTGCTGTRWPWLTIIFYDNNTMSKDSGVI